ncbi:MAG: VOC family protein, partial [Terriglobia bacterium]
MRLFIALWFLSFSCAAPLAAQLTAAKDGPVAMGHHHLNVSDVEAHKRFWGELLGGTPAKLGNNEVYKFPNVLVFLRPHEPSGGSIGTSVNHIGFMVKDLKKTVSKLKAAGVPIVTRQQVSGGRGTSDIYYAKSQDKHLAFVMAPDNLKVELMENPSLSVPIANHHTHFATTDVKGLQAWYAKVFGAVPGMRGQFQA